MAHHKVNICLRKVVKGSSFRNEHANKFMIPFSGAFLLGRARVTVKHMCTPIALCIKFDGSGIGKFATIIAKKQRHQFRKKTRHQFQIETVKYVDYRLRIIGVPKKSKHEFSLFEVDGKKNLATF